MRTMKKGKEVIRVEDNEVDKYLSQRYYFCSRKEYKKKQKKNRVIFKVRFSGEIPKYIRHKKKEITNKIKETPAKVGRFTISSAKKIEDTAKTLVTKTQDKITTTKEKIQKMRDAAVAIHNIIKMNKILKKKLKEQAKEK